MEENWTDNFFKGPWLDLHLTMRGPSDIVRETDAIEAIAQLPKSARIIDIPCGPCDHAIELSKRGYRLTGVDLSEELLAEAAKRADNAGVSVDLIQEDMRRFHCNEPFDTLICLWGSFGYFDTEGDRLVLEAFGKLIRPGGCLLLDMLPLEGILMNFAPHDSQRIGNMIVVQNRSYDMSRQRIESDWVFHRGGDRIVRHSSMRLYTVRETIELLGETGFGNIELFDPETREAYELGAARTWIRARRS